MEGDDVTTGAGGNGVGDGGGDGNGAGRVVAGAGSMGGGRAAVQQPVHEQPSASNTLQVNTVDSR